LGLILAFSALALLSAIFGDILPGLALSWTCIGIAYAIMLLLSLIVVVVPLVLVARRDVTSVLRAR
jgi:hypothetical protein